MNLIPTPIDPTNAPLLTETMAQTLAPPFPTRPASPLILADRLLTLAQDADRAGYHDEANDLLTLVYKVLDNPKRH